MTGYGEASHQRDGTVASIEIRTINGRFLKVIYRCPEGYNTLEPELERFVRQRLKRGSVQINLRVSRESRPDDFRLDPQALRSYREQLEAMHHEWHLADKVSLESLLALPGVVDEERLRHVDAGQMWPLVRETLSEALDALEGMRREEGAAMATDLKSNCEDVLRELAAIEARAPVVVDSYRKRIEQRVARALADHDLVLEPSDLIREVSIFADRSDISEEIVRLKSHAEQFINTLDSSESAGRKLEFITQEMFRETNTIGSKANDVDISQHVIEIKTIIEKLREMIQNVE